MTDARAYFRDVSEVVCLMAEARAVIDFGPPRRPRTGGRSDPATRTSEAEAVMEARATVEWCEDEVGEALRRIEGIRRALGGRYGDAIEARYVDLMAWRDVADELGVGESTARRLASAALDWCDAVGWAHVVAGLGVAES